MSEQKKIKVEIEDKINEVLTGDSLKNAQDFIGFLETNGLTLNSNNDVKETAWAHASNCGHCHAGWKDCGGGKRTIFGREFEYLYHSPLMFTDPDAGTLEHVKKLMLMLK